MSDEMGWDAQTSEENTEENIEKQIPAENTESLPRYGYYQVHQKEEPSSSEKDRRRTSRKKKEDNFGKKLRTTVALAVVFGLVSGAVFQGVNYVCNKLNTSPAEETELALAELLEDAPVTEQDSNSATVSSVASVAAASMPTVVAITSVSIQEIPSFFWYGTRQYQSAGSGSGIIVGENEEELLIATNNHVVEGATTLSVCFIGKDVVNAEVETENLLTADGDINVEDAVSAKIKGTDPENDLAVIAVRKEDIPSDTMGEIKIAQLGNSDNLVVGEQVVAIGNALGYGQSVTSGWISALNRSVYLEDGTNSDLIQTDAAINPGNSGGALLNMRGELIGINSAKYADSAVEGMGYAIPISKAQPILEELMNRKTRDKIVDEENAGYLGISCANLSQDAIQMYDIPVGAFVIKTTAGETADQAGIQKGDVITKMDGQKVGSKEALIEALQYYEAGEEVEIVLARAEDGRYVEKTITVVLGSRP